MVRFDGNWRPLAVEAYHLSTPREVQERLRDLEPQAVVVIEDFVGGGKRDPNVIYTLQLLGFARWYAELELGLEVVVQSPQIRYPCVTEATSLIASASGSGGGHAIAALAHVLIYVELKYLRGEGK